MTSHEPAPTLLRPSVFDGIDDLYAAFTTRHFAGPDRAAARNALERLARTEGFEGVATAGQVHGSAVAAVDRPAHVPDHDGLVTTTPGLLLATVAADCALVLLADPEVRAAGACHAGWRGAVAGVVPETVRALVRLGARPDRLYAYVGPCISTEAFEVGDEVAAAFDRAYVVRRADWPRPHVDLRAAVVAQLRAAGVPPEHTEVADACTATDPAFYSYRAEAGTTGRMFGLVGWRGGPSGAPRGGTVY